MKPYPIIATRSFGLSPSSSLAPSRRSRRTTLLPEQEAYKFREGSWKTFALRRWYGTGRSRRQLRTRRVRMPVGAAVECRTNERRGELQPRIVDLAGAQPQRHPGGFLRHLRSRLPHGGQRRPRPQRRRTSSKPTTRGREEPPAREPPQRRRRREPACRWPRRSRSAGREAGRSSRPLPARRPALRTRRPPRLLHDNGMPASGERRLVPGHPGARAHQVGGAGDHPDPSWPRRSGAASPRPRPPSWSHRRRGRPREGRRRGSTMTKGMFLVRSCLRCSTVRSENGRITATGLRLQHSR